MEILPSEPCLCIAMEGTSKMFLVSLHRFIPFSYTFYLAAHLVNTYWRLLTDYHNAECYDGKGEETSSSHLRTSSKVSWNGLREALG